MDRDLKPIAIALIAAVGLALSACEGGGDPVAQAQLDAVTANRAAANPLSADDHAAMGHAAGPGAGDSAFAASEAEMHSEMATATGSTVDEAYIAKMIAHHRGAIAMAEVALAQSRDPAIQRMAQAVKDAQTVEIAMMQAWTPAPAEPPAPAATAPSTPPATVAN